MLEKITCSNSTYIEVENRANLKFSHDEKLYAKTKGTVIWNGSAAGVSLQKFDIEKKEEFRNRVRSQYKIAEDCFVFGFMGRITKDKGVNELLKAAKMIIPQSKNIKFLIVGSLSEKNVSTLNQDLFGWAQSCSQIIFVDRTPNPEYYYAAMDCYVMPSYREGFGMTVIEAQAMGVPVIISEITGHEDTMVPQKTGFYVAAKNHIALFEIMKRVLNEPELCKQMGFEARKYVVQNFEQEELMRQIVAARKRLISD